MLDEGKGDSPFWIIPIWTLSSILPKGKGWMEKTIYSREYAVVLRLLREARERAGLTQVQLAKKLKLTQSFVSKIERGDRRLDVVQLRTVCKVLGVSLGEFVKELEAELAR
jgi:ribosome-binding protein aMBF1 (putative translation factor)